MSYHPSEALQEAKEHCDFLAELAEKHPQATKQEFGMKPYTGGGVNRLWTDWQLRAEDCDGFIFYATMDNGRPESWVAFYKQLEHGTIFSKDRLSAVLLGKNSLGEDKFQSMMNLLKGEPNSP